MSKLLEDVNAIDELIRDMRKIDSKLIGGQCILAYRDVGRVLAKLQKAKEEILKSADPNEK